MEAFIPLFPRLVGMDYLLLAFLLSIKKGTLPPAQGRNKNLTGTLYKLNIPTEVADD